MRGSPPTPLAQRFWRKVRVTSGCWEWQGAKHEHGYGRMRPTGSRKIRQKVEMAHRLAWMLTHGPIPTGLSVCHRCDNPPCCNPDHLFLGSHSDNFRDAARKGRLAQQKLNFAIATQIRREYRRGRGPSSMRGLAERYGVNSSCISDIITGKAYPQ